jgi:hypothetical protein
MILLDLSVHLDVVANVVSPNHISASVDSFISEAGSVFKTKIEGAENAATGLTGIASYLAYPCFLNLDAPTAVCVCILFPQNYH